MRLGVLPRRTLISSNTMFFRYAKVSFLPLALLAIACDPHPMTFDQGANDSDIGNVAVANIQDPFESEHGSLDVQIIEEGRVRDTQHRALASDQVRATDEAVMVDGRQKREVLHRRDSRGNQEAPKEPVQNSALDQTDIEDTDASGSAEPLVDTEALEVPSELEGSILASPLSEEESRIAHQAIVQLIEDGDPDFFLVEPESDEPTIRGVQGSEDDEDSQPDRELGDEIVADEPNLPGGWRRPNEVDRDPVEPSTPTSKTEPKGSKAAPKAEPKRRGTYQFAIPKQLVFASLNAVAANTQIKIDNWDNTWRRGRDWHVDNSFVMVGTKRFPFDVPASDAQALGKRSYRAYFDEINSKQIKFTSEGDRVALRVEFESDGPEELSVGCTSRRKIRRGRPCALHAVSHHAHLDNLALGASFDLAVDKGKLLLNVHEVDLRVNIRPNSLILNTLKRLVDQFVRVDGLVQTRAEAALGKALRSASSRITVAADANIRGLLAGRLANILPRELALQFAMQTRMVSIRPQGDAYFVGFDHY